ncbi:hypothetical protein GCM10010384_04960 [Streptomyces djakartensis]|uniref:Uncharacterized protein n=1 Tax=Streptomyces djakartensis TaxID=68193 RepID=A0ABQ2Z7S8_9ACTN|nr:hypothetical protein GCM10010384_04960 [Streptomyces djakartensis]
MLDSDPFPYPPTEAKDRWSLPRAPTRARWPKDPLNGGRPAQVTQEKLPDSAPRAGVKPVELRPVRLRRGVSFSPVLLRVRAVRITRKEAEAHGEA